MKRQIMKSLMAFCTGVMTLCAASSLFVSCFDDSELLGKIENLEKRVTEIEKLKEDLTALTQRVDALYTLKFQVTDSNELQYSFDNGATWVNTGVVLAEDCTCPEVSLVDNGDSVTITVGDQSFTIEKPEEIVFEIKSGKLYFASEDTKTVNVVTTGIDDVTVMATPKGWTADLNSDGQLEITAPSTEDLTIIDPWWGDVIQEGTADATGYVKVHACSTDGKCMVGKLYVEVTESPITVNLYGGKYEVITTDVAVYFGASLKSELEADIKEFLDVYNASDYGELDWSNVAYPYDEPAEGDFATLLGADLVAGSEYVLWAIEYQKLNGATLDDFFLAYYTPTQVIITEDEAKRSAYDIHVSVDVVGASSYLAMGTTADDAEYMMETILMEVSGMGGGGWGPLATKAIESSYAKTYTEPYSGSLALIGVESFGIAPAAEYTLIILPLDGRPQDMYTAQDFVTKSFKSNALGTGGTVNANFEVLTEYVPYEGADLKKLDPYTELGVKVTATADNWKIFYGQWVTEEVYATDMYGGDAEMVVAYLTDPTNYYADALDNNKNFTGNMHVLGLKPGTTRIYVGFFVDENDKYGVITSKALTTSEVTKNETLILEATVNGVKDNETGEYVLTNDTKVEVTLTSNETVSEYRYIIMSKDDYRYWSYEGKSVEEVADILFFAESYEYTTITPADLVDGKLVIEGNDYNTSYYLAILPFDEAGNPTFEATIIDYRCDFVLGEVITDKDAFVSEPTIKFEIPENKTNAPEEEQYTGYGYFKNSTEGWDGTIYTSFYYNVSYTVEVAEGIEVLTYFAEASAIKNMTDIQKATALWAGEFNSYYINKGAGVFDKTLNGDDTECPVPYILVSWKTTDGKYYFKQVDITEEFETMYNDLMGN